MKLRKTSLSILIPILTLTLSQSYAASYPKHLHATKTHKNSYLQHVALHPAIQIAGYGGRQTVGQAQAIVPVFGDFNKIIFGIAEGVGTTKSSNGWLLGLGAGYRSIVNDRILGGYLLVDYSSSPYSSKFWIVNPGFESLGNWDFRANAYIPLNSKQQVSGEGFASRDFGIADFSQTTGHTITDQKGKLFEEASYGADVEVGTKVPRIKNLKAYVGGYYFKSKDMGSVTGVEARLTYELNHYTTIEVKNTYDNLHKNTTLLGVRFALGGFNAVEKKALGTEGRLLDPIEHNIATSAQGYATPTQKQFINNGQQSVVQDKISFVTPSTSTTVLVNGIKTNTVVTGDGTAENPYQGFNQAVLDAIKTDGVNKNVYLKSGTYNLSGATDTTGRLSFNGSAYSNINLYGRSSDWKSAASGDVRPTLNGGMDFVSSNNNTLDSVQVVYTTDATQGKGTLDTDVTYGVHGLTFNDTIGFTLKNSAITVNSTNASFSDSNCRAADALMLSGNNVNSIYLGDNNYLSVNTASPNLNASTIRAGNNTSGSVGQNLWINGDNNVIKGTALQGGANAAVMYNTNLSISGKNNTFDISGASAVGFYLIENAASQGFFLEKGADNTQILVTGTSTSGYAEAFHIQSQGTLSIESDNNTITAQAPTEVDAIYLLNGYPSGSSSNIPAAFITGTGNIINATTTSTSATYTIAIGGPDGSSGSPHPSGSTGYVKINTGNTINVNSNAGFTAGVVVSNFTDTSATAKGYVDMNGATLNVTNKNGSAYGLFLGLPGSTGSSDRGVPASQVTVINSKFNITGNSNSWGIYSNNAVYSASDKSRLADTASSGNVFTVTSSSTNTVGSI